MNELQLSSDLNVITAEINSYKQVAGQAVFEIGRRLKGVRDNPEEYGLNGYRDWEKWCVETLDITRNYANRYIKVVEELGDTSHLNLGAQALYHIATLPEEEREKEHVTSKGETKTVDEMTVRELQELKRKLREEEKARQQAEQQAEAERRERERLEEENEKLANQEPKVIEKEIDKTDYEKIRQLEKQLEKARKERQKAIEESDKNIEALEHYMNSYVKPEQERKARIVAFTNDLSVGVSNLASNIEKAKQRLDGTINNDEQVVISIERAIESLKDYIITLDEMKGGDVIEIN